MMFARISTYKLKPESVADAEAKVQELLPTIWSEFSQFLSGPPVVHGYRVIAHESN